MIKRFMQKMQWAWPTQWHKCPGKKSSITKLFLFLDDSHQALVRWPWRATQKGLTRRRRALMHWQSLRDRALCNLRREEYCGVFTAQGNINRYFLFFSWFVVLLFFGVFLSVSYCWKGIIRKYLYSCSRYSFCAY